MKNFQENIDLIKELFRIEEERSEKLVNYSRVLISLMYFSVGLGIRKEIPIHSFTSIMIVSSISLGYSVFLLFYLRKGKYKPELKYLSSLLDVTLVALALWSFGSYRTFKSEAFLLFFLWIGLAAMRFSTKLTLYTGVWSVFLYILIVIFSLSFKTIESGTITESFTSQKVSMGNVILKIVFMTALFSSATYIAAVYKKLVHQSVEKELQARAQEDEKEKILDTFSRYVSPTVAQNIMKEGIYLGGEKRTATMLFSDIRGFTALSEKIPAEEVVDFLNNYLKRMVDIIFEYGGTLDKFVGDEIMAVFGVPLSTGNDEEMAVRVALKMRLVLSFLNDDRKRIGEEPIRIGIGIHSGEVIAGNIGSEKRMEYTVVGKNVNLASRIEAANKAFGTDILITEVVYEKLQDVLLAERNQPIRVKGIETPIVTYKVLGFKDDSV